MIGLGGLALGLVVASCRSDGEDPCEGRCGTAAYCDAVIAACICEVGAAGDPHAGCTPAEDACAEAEGRLGHSVCEPEIVDEAAWSRLSIGHANHASLRRGAKYLVPATLDARLPILFSDTNWYRSHYCVMAEGFEPRFPGLRYEDYQQLVLAKETREYYGGTIHELSEPGPNGERFLFTLEIRGDEEELLSVEQIYRVYRQLQDRFPVGELSYWPDSALHVEQAMSWDDPPFPVLVVDEASGGPQYEAYTPGLAYGRVRLYTAEELSSGDPVVFGWQDVVVLEEAPDWLEGVMAASITATRQDVLTHLNVLSSLRGTPNAHVTDALQAFAPYEGQLVRLEALGSYYSVREATVAEAEAHWAQVRPRAELRAPPDFDFAELLPLDGVPVGTPQERNQAVSRFGSKATGLATLRSVADTTYVVNGFAIPMSAYRAFMESNTWSAPTAGGMQTLSYAQTIDTWLADDQFRSDAALRSTRLGMLRDQMEDHGVVDPALLEAIRAQVLAVFGDETIMMRFRSSSNAEDSLSFNGAGLYESKSGCVADAADDPVSACEAGREAEPVDAALRDVWASLWSFGAYEEREYYQLPHDQVGMGVLVNPRFALERANGVAFTGNPTDLEDPRFTVNVQLGEVPVVGSTPGVVAELDRLRMEGGQVVGIDREVGSTLVPQGEHVLDDDQLRALGELLWDVAEVYPVDEEPPEGTRVMHDLELKITAEGDLVLKQIRPFAARPYEPGEGRCG